MGDDQFRAGVRLHLSRHMYGNADTDQFFEALADAAHDPRIVAAMRSFVDQQGVPLVTLTRAGDGWRATQSPYAFLGQTPAQTRWLVPLCLRVGENKRCTLLDGPSGALKAMGDGVLIPNAGGDGYYRFELPTRDWDRLIGAVASLPAGEALAVDDSLWASFRAGRAPPSQLVAEARSMLGNPHSDASLSPGDRFAGLRLRGLIEGSALANYRRLVLSLYAPRLTDVGFDPRAGAYASEAPDHQKFRQHLVRLLASEANDAQVQGKLASAATAYLAGDHDALDQGFMAPAFAALVRGGGVEVAKTVAQAALSSEDPVFRGAALGGIAASRRPDVAEWALALADGRLRPVERLSLFSSLATTAETRDVAADWILANYKRLATGGFGIFVATRLPGSLGAQCSAARADEIDRTLGPEVRALGVGVLDYERTVEAIRHCSDLKAAREMELADALAAAG
jgi:hypothetical protein